MRRATSSFAAECIALAVVCAESPLGAQPTIDFDQAWFSPSLIEDGGPICDEVLAHGRRMFVGDASLSSLDPREPIEIAGLEPVRSFLMDGNDPYVIVNDRKLYWVDAVAPGNCGGACERRQVYVTPNRPPPRAESYSFLGDLQATPAAYRHEVFRDGLTYYVLSVADEQLLLHEVTADAAWRTTCRVRLTPSDLSSVGDEQLAVINASLEALRAAVDGLIGGAGDCGSMQTHSRLSSYVKEQLEQLVFRPRSPRAADPDDDDAYAIDMQGLEKWALTGAAEHAALALYKERLARAVRDLTDFYVERYRAARTDAEELATYGLQEAVSVGIRFYEYSPFSSENEQRLRASILARRPLAELRTIDVPISALDGSQPRRNEIRRETVLNVAVGYPEALAYLLERGANPNSANAFGKTPLMYAAQQNALEAAKLLLAAGADPNAATTWPADRCYYTLSRASMTPLHYAVRYASAEFVDLLLAAGAAPYINTDGGRYGAEEEEYPLDWLRQYTVPGSTELNRNMAQNDVERLAASLAVPSAEDRSAIAAGLVIEAESNYAAGDVQTAYRLLMRAKHADASNARALSDLSLVALRAGQPSQAASAALDLLQLTDDADLVSNAWFNIGLSCEQPNARFTVRHQDGYVCRYSPVFPFLQAWQLRPTTARAEKLAEVFEERASCRRTREDDSSEQYILADSVADDGRGRSSRIYVRHAAALAGPVDAGWSLPPNHGVMAPVSVVARHELGAWAITVFESPGQFAPAPSDLTACRLAPQ